ncbi:PaaI family thioesterase [Dermatophilus congolensis]|uniref:PaaI family thioesterase n=1 Tax=Dermatophilus congolensis TaxID=1863 RepID=UPI001AAF2B2C|nr:PaaI family thioesterase [Dermatophilus congolensis]MBO3143785.1 PaaI family thioesterase [Dermatophilus congolensis]MBO3152776.1 PaaI family thioesterase [Dermatophilus congolensis]MBO3160213.1 PaaI family thioesterase [Dermatophilus congolensis]MBO3164061.1 PaaI family thioesterase [Dermatophilus congolensis]MBO3177606.1 PaaI family thioesterase [Dermatophilus congolensis]
MSHSDTPTNPDSFDPLNLDTLNNRSGALCHRMGITFTEATPTRFTAIMPVEGNTQPYGLLHGGASATLAETVGSALAMHLAGPNRIAVGININATHHRAATHGNITAAATPIAYSRNTATCHISITDEDQNLICTATLLTNLRNSTPKPHQNR